MFAYRPRHELTQILSDFFNACPPSTVPSNFPAIAQRLADLQAEEDVEEYTSWDARTQHSVTSRAPLPVHGYTPEPAMEAPQERDLDARLMARKVERALMRMSREQRETIEAAYDRTAVDPKLDAALTQHLAPLAEFSRLEPHKHLDDPRIMAAIRMELDELWRNVHCAFENEFKNI
jgi:hypothetical protein